MVRYKRLHSILKQRITEGSIAPGELLPSENELCAVHGLAKSTVRQALDLLVHEGLIEKHPGKGSIVAAKTPSLSLLSFKGFSEAVGNHFDVESQFIIKPEVMPWPNPFIYPLTEKELVTGCIYMQRLRLADEKPVMLENTYLPVGKLPQFTRRKFVQNSLFETLYQVYDIKVVSLEQDIRALQAEEQVADKLKIKSGMPILHIKRKYIAQKKDFVFYSNLYCNTEHFAFSGTYKI